VKISVLVSGRTVVLRISSFVGLNWSMLNWLKRLLVLLLLLLLRKPLKRVLIGISWVMLRPLLGDEVYISLS
jgi:hypothetical protein